MSNKVFNNEGECGYDERLEKVEKKLRSLYFLFFGFLFGHFLGLLLC